MNVRAFGKLLRSALRRADGLRERHARDRRNVDVVLAAATLGNKDALSGIEYPVAYVEFLRSCIEKRRFSVREIRADGAASDGSARRFATAVNILRDDPLPIPFALATEMARVADRLATLSQPMEVHAWAADVGLHFAMSSSLGRKGRLLFNLVRVVRPERCLDLGTAYGMSALFTLGALRTLGESGQLVSVDGYDPPFSIAAQMLRAQHGDRVTCVRAMLPDALHELAHSFHGVDFMFHDAGHAAEDYIQDFEAALPLLAPAAIVLIDDIDWEGSTPSHRATRAYEGWRQVARHPRVRRAVEIDDSLGLLLLT